MDQEIIGNDLLNQLNFIQPSMEEYLGNSKLINKEYPLYSELKELYLKGELKVPDDGWFIMYITERRKLLGPKYLHFVPARDFKQMVELDKKQDKEFYKLLWKKPKLVNMENILLKAILDTSEQHKITLQFLDLPKFEIGDIITYNISKNINLLVKEVFYARHNYTITCEIIKPTTFTDLDLKYLIPGMRFITISRLFGEFDTQYTK